MAGFSLAGALGLASRRLLALVTPNTSLLKDPTDFRSAYLLQSVAEFNDRTQKLFNNVTVEYGNGTNGPLSLKRAGLTDADRKMVLREVAKIGAKARSLGRFR